MKTAADMTRWEAMDVLCAAMALIREDKWGSVAVTLGMTDDIAAGLPLEQVMECITVRLYDVAFRAGVVMPS